MKTRADKIARIASILKQQYRLAEWQLLELRRRQQELQSRETYLLDALSGNETLAGFSSESIARQLAATSTQSGVVRAAGDHQADKLRAEAKKVKQTERLAGSAAIALRRYDEKRLLEEITSASANKTVGQERFDLDDDDKEMLVKSE